MSADSFDHAAVLADEDATIRLGEDLAAALRPGDCLCLSGDLGAGKSSLARALIRALADDEALEVPSPTFTLVQSYDLRFPVAHFDLYRLADSSELDELGFEEALNDGICLVEWPQKADDMLPADRILLDLEHLGDGRSFRLRATGTAAARLHRTFAIRRFLETAGHAFSSRRFLTGDASLRSYESIYDGDGHRTILMDWPLPPEGPPVADGLPYAELVHLARTPHAYVAVAKALQARGLAAPVVYAADYDQGFLLVEDLGREGILDAQGAPIAERYKASVQCLAALHAAPVSQTLPLEADRIYRLPDFDRRAMKTEAQLLLDWYLPWCRDGQAASEEERASYFAVWDTLIDRLESVEKGLLLRDVHSPNLIWRDERKGLDKVGFIDFQDAMIGPTSYDLASLVQDARVTVPPALQHDLLAFYVDLRRRQGSFDVESFMTGWSIMAAQRNCKLVGIWVRLLKRDGKPGYLRHMPRTLGYLQTALAHPALSPLRDWCQSVGMPLDQR